MCFNKQKMCFNKTNLELNNKNGEEEKLCFNQDNCELRNIMVICDRVFMVVQRLKRVCLKM
jgi:hypothetical protein